MSHAELGADGGPGIPRGVGGARAIRPRRALGQARRRKPDHVIGHRHDIDGNGHRAAAAKILGISERNLYRKLREYNLLDPS